MELKYKSSLGDYIDAGVLRTCRIKWQYYYGIIFLRIVLPICTLVYLIYLLYYGVTLNTWMIFVRLFITTTVAFFTIGPMLRLRYRIQFKKLLEKHPHLVEEKKIIPLDNKIKIIYENREMTVELKYILEKDDKLYLYGEKYLIVAIIPCELFCSKEEKEDFLSIINLPTERFKRKFLYWGIWWWK